MACLMEAQVTTITIPNVVNKSGYTMYEIHIKVDNYCWKCYHRYKDFVEFHEKVFGEKNWPAADRDTFPVLPKKKVIGNHNPTFVEKRRGDLEKYLQDVYSFVAQCMPRDLAEFLHFDEYDITFLLHRMAQTFFLHGESLLSVDRRHSFSVLEMHAISRRLKMPCHHFEGPPNQDCDGRFDFSHVVEFCSQLESLVVMPVKYSTMEVLSCEDLEQYGHIDHATAKALGTSNIIPHDLQFDLAAFRNLKNLTMFGVSASNIIVLDPIRESLESFTVHQTNANHLGDVLQCDDMHRNNVTPDLSRSFPNLRHLNISQNQLQAIDSALVLTPKLQTLILNRNRIETVSNLRSLSHLVTLSLRDNRITACLDWHLELGNLVTLVLAQNFIKTLTGFRKLFSLHNLDLSCNQIADISEVDHLAQCPYLESLQLTGNPVASAVDYRAKVLSRFKDRVQEFHLDNEKAGQKEVDTALVLAALRLSKENTTQSPSKVPINLGFST